MAANATHATRYGRHPQAWQATVRGLIINGAIVHVACSSCGLWRRVDLLAIAVAMGDDFSLWDRRPRCRENGCDGQVFFHASPGEGTISRPLKSF